MRSFALMAIMAAAASAVSINEADLAGEKDIQAAVNAIVDNVDASNDQHADGAHLNSATDEAIVGAIDGAFAKTDALGAPPQEYTPEPDNYRPPPVQDHSRRERRERPNIHDHGLLKSMNLNYVNSGW